MPGQFIYTAIQLTSLTDTLLIITSTLNILIRISAGEGSLTINNMR